MRSRHESSVVLFVRHADIEAYESCGWTLISRMADCHHGKYSALMQAPKNWPFK